MSLIKSYLHNKMTQSSSATLFRYLELSVNDLFSDKEWSELNDVNVQDLSNRIKIAEAIVKGKLTVSLLESDFDHQNPEY